MENGDRRRMEEAMAPRFALPFLLVATLLASSLVMADKSFDFYILILQWPGSYCAHRKRCCKPTTGYPAKDFFVRFLETYDEITGEPLSRCNKWPFDVNQVVDERSELQQYWSSIRCPSNDGVSSWKNAWVNFGVCSNLTQPDYFTTALQLRAKVDVLSALANNGIAPGSDLYSVEKIRRGIREEIGVEPIIRCSQLPGIPDKMLLYEIAVCASVDGQTLIDCPVRPYFRCSDLVYFPPFEYGMLHDTATSLDGNNPIQMPVTAQ